MSNNLYPSYPIKVIPVFLFLFFIFSGFSQNNIHPLKIKTQQLDAMITQGMADWKVPGLATVVVKDGDVVFQKSYGFKNIHTKEEVDEQTLFSMASTTKAFVAIALGMLVDQGKLQWEDKVREHLPTFELSDPYIAAEARVQDLLTHNLGFENADLLWIADSLSSAETLRRFRLAEKIYPLRGGYTYQNIMYVVAGEVIEAVSDSPWHVFVKENIFNRLDMTRSQPQATGILKAGNYTTPHFDDWEEGVIEVGYSFADQIGAAGMMWSCIEDISNYLKFLVNDGVFNGDTLLQPKTFKYLFQPHALLPAEGFYPTRQLTQPNWMSYGLGWFQHDYRGAKLDFHTGSLSGLVAIAGIMHEHNTAVYVFANLDHAELRHAIMYKALDLYAFNDNSRNWHEEVFNLYDGFKQQGIRAQERQLKARVLDTHPTLPLKSYVGTYQHKMWGWVKVTLEKGKLQLNFNDFLFHKTEHWHYDTFRTDKDAVWNFRGMVDFDLNQNGKVESLEVFGEEFRKKS